MTLTAAEETRIKNLELELQQIRRQLEGAASKQMLNRLLTLSNKDVSDLEELVAELTTKVETLITLARKLQ